MEPILIPNCVLSRQIFTEYNLLLFKKAFQTKRTKFLVLVGLIAIGFFINLYVYYQGGDEFPLVQGLILAGIVVLYVMGPRGVRTSLNKRFDALPILQASTSYTLTESQVIADNTLTHSEMSWSLFSRADTYGKWLMIHLQNRTMLALDTTRTQVPHTLPELLLLLHQHNIPLNQDEALNN